MENKTFWRQFCVGDLLYRKTPPSTGVPAKNLNVSEEQKDDLIPLITRGKSNNGIVGYIEKGSFETAKNKITYNDQFGLVLYHPYEFTTIKDHLSVLEANDSRFGKLMDKSHNLNFFIAKMIDRALSKKVYSFNYNPTEFRFGREIIVLPIKECDKTSEIWLIDNRSFTVDLDKIDAIIEGCKERVNKRTIEAYKTARDDYEELSKKYKGLINPLSNCVWKSFSLEELFDFNSGNQLSDNKKNLEISETKEGEFEIALITQSEKNNGIIGYLKLNEEIESKKMSNALTYSMHFGLCFYHDYDFVLMDTHGSVFRLIAKNSYLLDVLSTNKDFNYFIGKSITKVCRNGVYNYGWLPNSTRVGREIIMLPLYESDDNDGISVGGKVYKIDIARAIYLYAEGKKRLYQNKIDNFQSYIGG